MSSIAARFPDMIVKWCSQILATGPLHVEVHPVSRNCGLVCNDYYLPACQKCSKTGHIPGVFPLGVAYLSSALVGNLAEGLDRSPQTVTVQYTESLTLILLRITVSNLVCTRSDTNMATWLANKHTAALSSACYRNPVINCSIVSRSFHTPTGAIRPLQMTDTLIFTTRHIWSDKQRILQPRAKSSCRILHQN